MSWYWLNGELTASPGPEQIYLRQGISVFTTLRQERGSWLYLENHFSRLRRDALALGITPVPEATWEDLLAGLPKDPLRVRLTLSPVSWSLEARPYQAPPEHICRGVKVVATEFQVLPGLARYKTGSRLPYHLAAQAAQRQGAFEALLVDPEGHVVDGTVTSPLLYREGVLTSLTGGLDGITRYQVIRQAQALGLRVASAALSWPECQGQLLLAGSGVGLVPVGIPVDPAVTELVRLFRPMATG